MSRRAEVARQARQRLAERLAEREAEQRLRDMTIVERNSRGRVTSREEPLPYGSLPASAANTPGFVVGMPVDPSTFPAGQPPATGLSDDVSARESALTAMRQQYAPGSQFFETEAGKAMIQQAKNNQYEGDAAGLAEFNTNQRKVGIGAIDEIINAMGYAGTPMEEWARANENLALREYNKKFGGPAEYAGTGPSDEEIKAAMEAGQFYPAEGSPNPLGRTGIARESNTEQTRQAQPVKRQAINNESLNAIDALRTHTVPGLKGMDTLQEYARKLYGGK